MSSNETGMEEVLGEVPRIHAGDFDEGAVQGCGAFRFELEATSGRARAGRLTLPHGEVETPIFMPVGTYGSVKGVSPTELVDEVGAQIVLGNTYHLYIRPGLDVVAAHGGLHEMMRWERPILTDSGGFQVYSLEELRTISEDGVRFQDHKDGRTHMFSPELVCRIQETLGSDIMMAFDECPPIPSPRDYLQRSMARTTRWAKRGLMARQRDDCAMFGIVQGGTDVDLRREHAEAICALPFEGFAIGGLSVGETTEAMLATVEATTPWMPDDKPKYLMGVGTPEDLVEAIARGVDMFDCVMPTRNARNGQVFVTGGKLNMRNARFRHDLRPIDERSSCPASREFSRAYLRHLIKEKEILGARLLTLHNLHHYLSLVREARQAIVAGDFEGWRQQWYARRRLAALDLEKEG